MRVRTKVTTVAVIIAGLIPVGTGGNRPRDHVVDRGANGRRDG